LLLFLSDIPGIIFLKCVGKVGFIFEINIPDIVIRVEGVGGEAILQFLKKEIVNPIANELDPLGNGR
jgi:hypothetical protein